MGCCKSLPAYEKLKLKRCWDTFYKPRSASPLFKIAVAPIYQCFILLPFSVRIFLVFPGRLPHRPLRTSGPNRSRERVLEFHEAPNPSPGATVGDGG